MALTSYMIPGFCAVILEISFAHPDYGYLLYRSGLRKQVKNTYFWKIYATAAFEAVGLSLWPE